MKIKDIKTEKEFYQLADIWYQRTINLIHVVKDDSEDSKRRIKAFHLWHIMLDRMNAVVGTIQSNARHSIPSYHKGTGFVCEQGDEVIVNKDGNITGDITPLYTFKSATKQQCRIMSDRLKAEWLKDNPNRSIKDHGDTIKNAMDFLRDVENNRYEKS